MPRSASDLRADCWGWSARPAPPGASRGPSSRASCWSPRSAPGRSSSPWPRLWAALWIGVNLLYIPGAIAPLTNRYPNILGIVIRLATALLFLIQVLAGLMTVADFIGLSAALGIPLQWLPVTVVRGWHSQISILWISVCWFAATIWVLPLICRPEPRGQLKWINALFWMLLVTALGGITGGGLLLALPPGAFELVVPPLLLLSGVLAATQPRVAAAVAVLETRVAKLRLFRVPELISLSFVLGLLAVTSSFLLR